MKRIWIDITNTPQVNFLLPVIRYLEKKYTLYITARDFSETIPLLKQNFINPIIIGDHRGKNKINKTVGFIWRTLKLFSAIPNFDVSISMGGNQPALISYAKRKKSIIFSDNDLSFKGFSYSLGNHFIFPHFFNYKEIEKKHKIDIKNIHLLEGYKEDIYIADYEPDKDFLKLLPFNNFITIRPENLKASYVPANSVSIVPELFEKLTNYNILFLPRYKEEREYAKGYNNIYYPDKPLNGLDICFNSKVMLTGAGSFAREAALMGTPAISFFPSEKLLSVDMQLVKEGKILHSRNIDEIVSYVKDNHDKKRDFNERLITAKEIQKRMLQFIEDVIESC